MSKSECIVFLTGCLSAMPKITADWTMNSVIIVSRKFLSSEQLEDEFYHVIINRHDTARLVQSGFIGMPISVNGELRIENRPVIIAEEVNFTHSPNTSRPPSTSRHTKECRLVKHSVFHNIH